METTTRAKTWFRALVAAVSLCAAMNAEAAVPKTINSASEVYNCGAGTQINSTDRILIYQGTMNINEGASLKVGGDSGGSCNFIGIENDSPANVNINGGTLWCSTANGSGYLAVGSGINKNSTSTLTLNSGILKVDAVLRSSAQWNDAVGVTASGTITINGGEATVGTVLMGATSVSTGTSTLNLNGGTLTTGNITFRTGNGQVFTWGDGTLVATKANIFNVQTFNTSNTKTRTMEITGNPAVFDTAGFSQTIPAFTVTGTGKLRLTGNGAVAFAQSTLPYGLVLDGAVVNLGTLEANAVPITAKSLEIAGPVTLNVSFSASPSGRYPLIACTDSLDGSLDQITVVGSSGELVREGNTLYLSVEDVGGIDDCLFRYDFTSGGKVYSHIGHPTEPVSEWSGFTAVNGPGGHATAVHPCGVGTITDGENVLNNGDWTIAMCVKPGTVERGVLLSIGSGRCQQNSRDICFLSSSTPGRLRISSRQTWGSQNYNEPGGASMEVTGIGDTATSFHTIVATCTAYKNDTDGATMTIYVDGALKGSFDVDHSMTQQFKSTFCFGGPFEVVSGRTGWGSNTPFYDTSSNMDVAFRDVRFFTRILDADEAAAYAAAFPVVAATTNSIADCNFRHNFTSGKLAVEGNGYTDGATPMANTGTAVDDPYGFGTATFPDKAGYGSVNVGLDRDWTCAMTLRPGTVASNYGILCCLGGVTSKGIGVVVASTPNNGELRFAIPQNYNGGSGRNWTGNYITLTGLGDTVNEFHSLVLIHGRNQKANNANNANKSWSSGVISIYWDGEWKGALSTSDPAASNERPFLKNSVPSGTYNELTDSSCGAAFRDLRFTTNVWTSVEAHAYTKSMSPLKDYLFRYDFATGVKSYSHNGCATEPAGEWSGFTAVNGPDGYGTAVHACGTGTITDGDTKLNEDWTLAMSFKSCDVEKGVILCLGRCDTNQRKQLAICSSSTPGKIHIAAIQRWTGGSSGVNVPLTLNPTGLGDTTNAFHTLVAVHEASKGTKKFPGRQETGLITFYWDGAQIGTIDTGTNGGERLFESGFRFSALRTGLSGYADLTGNPDAALRDVRFFTRALPASEIALYVSQYPVATAAVCDVDDYHFRHNFAVEGSGFTDTSLAGTGTKVMGGVVGSKYAAFPDKAGVGTVNGGLNRDWTLAMSVKAPVVESGKNGIMLTLGGVETNQKKALTICSTADSTGGLFIAVPQRWGSAESSINTCQARISLSGLGDITNKYHSLVIVHARNQKNDSYTWQTGTYGIYWDGKYVNSLVNTDSRGLQFMDNLRYGAIYNRSLGGDGSTLQPFYVEPEQASGLAFQDVRFYTKILTSAEARAYAELFPVSEQSRRMPFTILIR